ncbi:MAG: cobyrinate a,c-diamide synthase [Deltaproteobacteria bacterium]|nr:cobyrinate a,c-diamide synthase [Deltaproteobacteria bacterium]
MNSFIIAATHSGAGKTTITLGLMSALRKRGMIVQPFKIGPDYIDPGYHKTVCGRPSYNLDTWMMGIDGVQRIFAKTMTNAEVEKMRSIEIQKLGSYEDKKMRKNSTSQPLNLSTSASTIAIIEGVMGLFDGKDGNNEAGSTGHIAKVFKLPVILVIDARSMARSVGALVYGFERFDPDVKVAGVIFNRVGSERHFKMLKEAVESKCRAKILGYIPRDKGINLPERHLGLVMAEEAGAGALWARQEAKLKKIGELIQRFVDVDGLMRLLRLRLAMTGKKAQNDKGVIARTLARSNLNLKSANLKSAIHNPHSTIVKIAVALDNAFCFYYQENLDMLKELGAEIILFSPLRDKKLPENTSGIYLGGGYPELYAKTLEANGEMRSQIKQFADKGLPMYAECGGLMYLGKGLKDLEGGKYEMAGVFPWVSRMLEKRKSLGYREVKAVDSCPFLKKGEKIRGHEYHYSEIDEPPQKIKRGYQLTYNPPIPPLEKGGKGGFEGYLYKNTLASYIHLHFASNPKFAEGFVRACSLCPPY